MKTLFIIGAGPGGYECAVRAAQQGLEVHIADAADHVGGTCLNEGCIPTKALCHAADIIHTLSTAATYGISTTPPTLDWSQAIAQKDAITAQLQHGIHTLLSNPNIHFHSGHARFEPGDAHTIHVGADVTVHADYVIIATGSQPKLLPIPGLDTPGVITSTQMLQLPSLPRRLCIIGGGVIGIEFACIAHAFGSEVTIIEYAPDILPAFDADIAKRLRLSLKKRGINLLTKAPVTAIHADSTQGGEIHVSYEHRDAVHDHLCDLVLMAVGRQPNLHTLNLNEAGIAYTPHGITTDAHYRTNVEGIYACGDINGRCALAHAATFQSYHALNHLLGQSDHIQPDIMPAAVFSNPEVSMVGLTEEAARKAYPDCSVLRAHYRANGRALATGAFTDGFVKLIVRSDGTIVGAHILGQHAAELIHEVTVLMNFHGTLNQLRDIIHAHPTLSELFLQFH